MGVKSKYDFGPRAHGQTWWYDEYDGGAGSSLAAGVDAGATTLMVAPGTGARFRAGEVVRVPVARFGRDVGVGAVSGVAARLTVTRAVPDKTWTVHFAQAGCQVTAGVTYTLSFSARPSAGQLIEAGLQQTYAPFALRASQEFTLDRQWRRYRVTFTPTASESNLAAQFNLAAAPGTVWLSAISLQRGDPNVWRRDFAHGTVLLNATATPRMVVLGPGYRHLLGTQDRATNNEAPAWSVTLAPQDAVLLVLTRGR